MKPQTGPADRVQVSGQRHHFGPAGNPVAQGGPPHRRHFLPPQKARKVRFRARPARQAAQRPAEFGKGRAILFQIAAAQGGLLRQPVRGDPRPRDPAKFCRHDQGQPVPSAIRAAPQPVIQRPEPRQRRSRTRLGQAPQRDYLSLIRHGAWQGRHKIGILLRRAGQEPQIRLVQRRGLVGRKPRFGALSGHLRIIAAFRASPKPSCRTGSHIPLRVMSP